MFMKFRPSTAAPSPSATALALQALLAPAAAPAEAAADSAPPDGSACGWFDSSYELGRGLQVTEHEGFEWLDEGLPLSDWLQ